MKEKTINIYLQIKQWYALPSQKVYVIDFIFLISFHVSSH